MKVSESADGPLIRRTTARDGLRLAWVEHLPAAPAAGPDDAPAGAHDAPLPVLCLPGMTRNARDFAGLAGWLAAGGAAGGAAGAAFGARRVICPDYRGRGLSAYDPDPANYRVETYLDDVRSVLTAAGVHRAVVIGTSLGGIIAMAMGTFMPTVTAGVLMNDIGPEIKMRTLDGVAAHIRAHKSFSDWDEAAAYLRAAFPGAPGAPARSDEDWLADARARYREGRDGRLVMDCDPAIGRALDDPKRPEMIEIWRLYDSLGRVPAAAVRGAASEVCPAELLERMAARRSGGPGGDLIQAVVDGAGHAPDLNEPESREAVQKLLAAVG